LHFAARTRDASWAPHLADRTLSRPVSRETASILSAAINKTNKEFLRREAAAKAPLE
jgi:hypothetical protein